MKRTLHFSLYTIWLHLLLAQPTFTFDRGQFETLTIKDFSFKSTHADSRPHTITRVSFRAFNEQVKLQLRQNASILHPEAVANLVDGDGVETRISIKRDRIFTGTADDDPELRVDAAEVDDVWIVYIRSQLGLRLSVEPLRLFDPTGDPKVMIVYKGNSIDRWDMRHYSGWNSWDESETFNRETVWDGSEHETFSRGTNSGEKEMFPKETNSAGSEDFTIENDWSAKESETFPSTAISGESERDELTPPPCKLHNNCTTTRHEDSGNPGPPCDMNGNCSHITNLVSDILNIINPISRNVTSTITHINPNSRNVTSNLTQEAQNLHQHVVSKEFTSDGKQKKRLVVRSATSANVKRSRRCHGKARLPGKTFNQMDASRVNFKRALPLARSRFKKGANAQNVGDSRTECDVMAIVDFNLFKELGSNAKMVISALTLSYRFTDEIIRRTNFDGHPSCGIVVKEFRIHTAYSKPTTHYNSHTQDFIDAESLLEAMRNSSGYSRFYDFCLVHLNCKRSFRPNVAGMAYWAEPFPKYWSAGICGVYYINRTTPSPSNVLLTTPTEDIGIDLMAYALVITHEIGHAWGSDHDPRHGECWSPHEGFLMNPSTLPRHVFDRASFSMCSIKAISTLLKIRREQCFLKKEPPHSSTCGNGQLDAGEDCDPGSAHPDDRQCCTDLCQLKSGANENSSPCTPNKDDCTDENCRDGRTNTNSNSSSPEDSHSVGIASPGKVKTSAAETGVHQPNPSESQLASGAEVNSRDGAQLALVTYLLSVASVVGGRHLH